MTPQPGAPEEEQIARLVDEKLARLSEDLSDLIDIVTPLMAVEDRRRAVAYFMTFQNLKKFRNSLVKLREVIGDG